MVSKHIPAAVVGFGLPLSLGFVSRWSDLNYFSVLFFCFVGMHVESVQVRCLVAMRGYCRVFHVKGVSSVVNVTKGRSGKLCFIATRLVIRCFVYSLLTRLSGSVSTGRGRLFPLHVIPVFAFNGTQFQSVGTCLTTIWNVCGFYRATALVRIRFRIRSHFFFKRMARGYTVRAFNGQINEGFQGRRYLKRFHRLIRWVGSFAGHCLVNSETVAVSTIDLQVCVGPLGLTVVFLTFRDAGRFVRGVVGVRRLGFCVQVVSLCERIVDGIVTRDDCNAIVI